MEIGQVIKFKEKSKCGKYNWDVTIRFVPFENERQRDEAYDVWVRTFLEAQREKLNKRKR